MKATLNPKIGIPLGICRIGLTSRLELAQSHARSGDAARISGYLGSGDVFDRAMVRFAHGYADQTEKDYEALVLAKRKGKIKAESGI